MKRRLTNSNINERIDRWHEGNSELSLHEYLGLSEEEYAHWVETNELPNGLKKNDIVRSTKQPDSVIPYQIINLDGADAKCINLIDTYHYTIPLKELYLWIDRN